MGNFAKEDISQNELTSLMAGGAELEALQHEIAQAQNSEPDPADAPHGPETTRGTRRREPYPHVTEIDLQGRGG